MDAEKLMMLAAETMEQLKAYNRELQQLRIPTDIHRR